MATFKSDAPMLELTCCDGSCEKREMPGGWNALDAVQTHGGGIGRVPN